MQSSNELEKALLDAKAKVRVAVVGAVCSLVGAFVTAWLSYDATTRIEAEKREVTIEIAQLKDQVERGTLAMRRAKMVERLLEELTSGEETRAKMAFLNLWQLHPDPTERSIFILTALEKSGPSVVKLMILLKSELGSHLEKIREAAEPTSCEEAGARDCAITENAKTLLMHIEPDNTLKLLLKQMNSYSSTGNVVLEDANVEFINNIIKYNPRLISKLEAEYINSYKHLHILSYILFAFGKKEYFREIIGENGDRPTQFELVGGIVTVPLLEIQEVEDWETLIRIALSALECEENSTAVLDMIRLLDRARVRRMLTNVHQGELKIVLTRLATSENKDISVRRRAISLLTNISSQTGVCAIRVIVEKEPLDRILQVQIQQIIENPKTIKWLKDHTNFQKLPGRIGGFNKLREQLMDLTF